jgi:hypothetical protein
MRVAGAWRRSTALPVTRCMKSGIGTPRRLPKCRRNVIPSIAIRRFGPEAMTTAAHPNIAKVCLICGGRLCTIAENLCASSSRAGALYPFTLFECSLCGHVQKDVGPDYQAHLDEVSPTDFRIASHGRSNSATRMRRASGGEVIRQDSFSNRAKSSNMADTRSRWRVSSGGNPAAYKFKT